MKFAHIFLFVLSLGFCCVGVSHAVSYKYKRVGSDLAAETHIEPGIALMGGGAEQKEAFRWLCGKGNGGDFLILRAHGNDDYNSYVSKTCEMNSVATLIIPDRKAAQEVESSAHYSAGERHFYCRRRPGALCALLEGNSGAGGD